MLFQILTATKWNLFLLWQVSFSFSSLWMIIKAGCQVCLCLPNHFQNVVNTVFVLIFFNVALWVGNYCFNLKMYCFSKIKHSTLTGTRKDSTVHDLKEVPRIKQTSLYLPVTTYSLLSELLADNIRCVVFFSRFQRDI